MRLESSFDSHKLFANLFEVVKYVLTLTLYGLHRIYRSLEFHIHRLTQFYKWKSDCEAIHANRFEDANWLHSQLNRNDHQIDSEVDKHPRYAAAVSTEAFANIDEFGRWKNFTQALGTRSWPSFEFFRKMNTNITNQNEHIRRDFFEFKNRIIRNTMTMKNRLCFHLSIAKVNMVWISTPVQILHNAYWRENIVIHKWTKQNKNII